MFALTVLLAFSGTGAGLPAAYTAGSQLAVQAGCILRSANAWQQVTAAMTLPAGTTLLLVQIHACEDVANDGTSPEFAGHRASTSQDHCSQAIDYHARIGFCPRKLSSCRCHQCVDRQRDNQCNQINELTLGACRSPR
jgi:hypothetical protein